MERLENLKDLDVSCNLIPSVPESVGKIRSLEHLDASHNKIVSLPNALFYLSNLTTLLLSNNMIENFGLDSTNVLKKLSELNISFNKFTKIDIEFEFFINLKTLRASHNNLSKIGPLIGELHSLQTLDFSYNMIETLTNSFEMCTSITFLDLSHNEFSEVPQSISCFNLLKNLNLSSCKISTGLYSSFFDNMLSTLEHLDLSCNRIPVLPSSFYNLKAVLKCDLSVNCISEIDFNIGSLDSIIELNLSSNKISSIPHTISKLMHLEALDLSHNIIDYLPKEFGDIVNLRKLNLEYNKFIKFPECLRSLTKLNSWNLNGNLIKISLPVSESKNTETSDHTEPITIELLEKYISEANKLALAVSFITPEQFEQKDIPEIIPLKGEPPLSAAQKRENKRIHAKLIEDLKQVLEKKKKNVHDTFDWIMSICKLLNHHYSQFVSSLKLSKENIYQNISKFSKVAEIIQYFTRENSTYLDQSKIMKYIRDIDKLIYIDLDYESQDAINAYQKICHLLVLFSKTNVANIKKEEILSDSNNLIASAFGDNDESIDKNIKIFYSNEIDETIPPQILFNIKFGSIREDIASLIFETYLNYGSLISKRIEKMIFFVRSIEKDYNILESCCGLVFRSGSDFEDLITEEYEIYKTRVESNSNLRKKLNQDISKSQEFLNLFNPNDPASASTKGKDLYTNKDIFNKEDAVELIEFLSQCIKYSSLWVLIVLSSAYEIMNLWGWDSGCPDFKLNGDYLIEPNARGRRSDCIRVNFLHARALQFNGRYAEAIIIYDKLLILFSLSNYTMYRKITIEKLKCLIQKGDYLLATDLLGLLKLKDFPDDSDNDLSEIKDNELLKILKLNKEIGLYILYIRALNKNLNKSGLGNFVQSRVHSLNKLGVLNAGKQYSCELQALGFDKDAKTKERKRKKELKDAATELEASRSVLKSLASNSIEKSTKHLEESFSVLINLNPDPVSSK